MAQNSLQKRNASLASRHNAERVKYAKDLIQPFKPDGTVNPQFVKVYKTDPRNDESHRSYARNKNNRGYELNKEVDEEMRDFEKRKYDL